MNKWYARNNKEEGNRWMRLGSKFAKALNPKLMNIAPGTDVEMSRRVYTVQADGSIRRKVKKNGKH